MNKKVFTLAIIALLTAFGLSSKADNATIDIYGGEVNIMGSTMHVPDYGKWYYFSFETGTVVGTSDFNLIDVAGSVGTEVPDAEWSARSDWDIAFHATDIRTNGAQAVLAADSQGDQSPAEVYAALNQAPDNGYEADALIDGTFIAAMTSMPPLRATQMSVCQATHGWASFGMGSSGVNPMVVVFKLSNGKYAKVYLKEFFGEEDKPGYIEIEYAYIPKDATAIDQSGNTTTVNIYPNPAAEILNVELPASAKDSTISIYNMTGALVEEVQAKAGVNKIAVSALPAGVYLLKTEGTSRKFVVR